jgi:hypothetical protein
MLQQFYAAAVIICQYCFLTLLMLNSLLQLYLLPYRYSLVFAVVVPGTIVSLLLIHCNEDPIYVFLFWELRGLSPFLPHSCVCDLYIPSIGPHIIPAAE